MVFESIVVDVINRFIGDYVENLNHNQLKLGIWGGDVVLENLVLKQNALEELNIPVQTVYGHLGKLVLKIPWKNLYGSSVEATVERLFLVVNPNQEVSYDAEKEEKIALASKQAELARVEEAKKKEAEKDDNKMDETFVEKLVTQIIKNVQLTITDIHIRYEDSVTDPRSPFSFGITLHNLSVHTTDENWKPTIIQDAVTKIFKILNMEGLAIYWNPKTELYSKNISDNVKEKLQSEIATKSWQPDNYLYVLGPINATAQLKLNPKPEADEPKFSLPKVILTLHMDQLSINMDKAQYHDMMLLADSMDIMAKGAPYRKYRPDVKTYKGNYKIWWKFAYTCILEEEVRRRRKNWDWDHMLAHRQLCRDYASAYHDKLTNKGKMAPECKEVLDTAENKLDLLNLVVIRQKIEMEVERLGKLAEESRSKKSWFSSWWGGNTDSTQELKEGTDIMKQFQEAMTPAEKEKLFRAIDYHENSAPLHLPAEYVAVENYFRLDRLVFTVNHDDITVLTSVVENVEIEVRQRPSANALRVDVGMHAFKVSGLTQGDFKPQIVTSLEEEDANLLTIQFEINPLEENCDQRVRLYARPLQIVYDAQTVIEIVNVFKPPSDSNALETLQAAAGNKLSDLKEKSALGMQYAVHKHTFIDIDIDIAASIIIIPQMGKYLGKEACVVIKLGAISVKSDPRTQPLDVHKLFLEGLDEEEIFQEIIQHSYDKMCLELTDMQIVISKRDEDWSPAIASTEPTHLHLLQPTNLAIYIYKCLITNDPRLPKIKIKGELQQIAVNISEHRLLALFDILVGMPLPHSEEPASLKASESKSSNLSLFKYLDPAEKQKRESARASKQQEETVQLTDLEALFIMKELSISVNRTKTDESLGIDKFLVFKLSLLELTALQKTFTMEATVRLGAVSMQHHRIGHRVLNIVETPEIDPEDLLREADSSKYLFSVTYRNVDKKCNEFHSHYGSVEQLIVLDLTTLKVMLHLEGLKEILVVVSQYQNRLQTITSTVDRVANSGPLETIDEDEELSTVKLVKATATKKSAAKQIESIQMKVEVRVNAVEIKFATDRRPLSLMQMHGAKAGLMLKSSYTEIDCVIAAIDVIDLNPVSLHKAILKVIGGDVMNVKIVMFNIEQFPTASDVNMSIKAEINCLRIVFLNWFVSSMLEFLNNFQTAQDAIIEASANAADVARTNVQSAYENSTKVCLKVFLAAPIIVVPENSRSMNAMLIDLGRMTMENKFIDLPIVDTINKVTVDELTLSLEHVKVSCVMLGGDFHDFTHERKLLRPTSFKLLVKRSLSIWYDALPQLDISGRMKIISITVGHSDYKSIMKILNQNLQEGQKKMEETRPHIQKAPSKMAQSKANFGKSSAQIPTKSTLTMAQSTTEMKPKTSMKFTFTMDSFVIDLMNTTTEGAITKDTELARFCLALLSVKGRMYTDGSMNASVLLVDCTMDDMRPGRGEKITRYLERRRGSNEVAGDQVPIMVTHDRIRSMVDITYNVKDSDTFIDMRIFSFTMILAMDFMNKLIEFMTTGLAAPPTSSENDTFELPKQTKPHIDKSVDNMLLGKPSSIAKKKLSEVSATNLPGQEGHKSMMTVNIKIEQPDILLVESLENKECAALVLNMEARFKLRQTEDHMVADGGISALQVIIRQFGQEESTPRYLFAPAHVSLAVAQPPNSGMHVDISVSDIKITVSPDVIALLNRVMATVTSTEENSAQQENKAIFYDNIWAITPFKPSSYWFLQTDEAEEAITVEDLEIESTPKPPPVGEICLLSSPSIVLALEMEIGNETIPVLVMQASLTGQAKDWSSEFYLESTWAMQVSYYNISRAVWEPLIEPIEVLKESKYVHVPWELKLEAIMRPAQVLQPIDTTDEAVNFQAVAKRQPNKTYTVSSSEPLEITVTRTAVEVLTQLSNTFAAATAPDLDASALSKTKIDSQDKRKKFYGAPYVLHNSTGLTAKLLLPDNQDFAVFLKPGLYIKDYNEVILESGASLPLQLKHLGLNTLKLNEPPLPLKLNVQIEEMGEELIIPVERADKRYFPLGEKYTTDQWQRHIPHVAALEPRGLISDIVMQDAAVHIYLRSIVQVTNELTVNVSAYYMTLSGNEVKLIGDVKPGDTLRLPLQAVHTPSAEIFFSVEGFTVSVSPVVWRELQQEVKASKLLQCESKDKHSGEKFYIKAVGEMEQVFFEHTNRHTFASCCYDIKLKPAVKLQNCLPVNIVVSQLGLKRTQTFEPGEMFNLAHLAPHKATIVVMIENYLDKCWVCTKNLNDEESEFSVWSFESHDSPVVMTLDLGMHNSDQEGTQVLSLYCPFWMLNKTGFTLCYRNADETGNVIFHPKDYTEPILFSFRAKNFFGKKKASIRIEFGEWSDKFSLDVPGSSGVVTCKMEGRSYQVAVKNQLTFNSLTKMVIFTPFYLIINEAPFAIQYQDVHRSGDPWQEVDQNSVAPLWPATEREEKLLRVRVACSAESCAPILFTEMHNTTLKLNNEYGGLNVDVHVSEGGTYITLQQYRDGHAPALLVNYTLHTVTVYEKENVNVKKLPPMNQMLFTWDNPAGPQILIFEGHKKKETENDLRQDGIGEFMINDTHRISWVSFLDGMQRVILFTDDPILASGAHTIGEAEPVEMELVLSIQGMGLSLVNDQIMQEIMYISCSKFNDTHQNRINDTHRISWVSFLDGMQRVILFTDDLILASGAHTIGEAEPVEMELVLSIQGMGLSLVNNQIMQEIMYSSCSNSGIIWEQCKLGVRRYKKLEGTKLFQMEEAYQRWIVLKRVSVDPVPPRVLIDEKTEVDFEEMRMLKPNARLLRRTLEPGIWASYGVTPHSLQIHARLHRLQVDQQLPLPTFPVVLAPVPPPRSIANQESIFMKPFIEVSIVERVMEHTKVRQYKYFKVLIQEFHVKVDMGLINAYMNMFPQQQLSEQEALEAFKGDLDKASKKLQDLAAISAASDQKNFYDNLHLSPLKVHVSFSLGGQTQLPSFIGTLLQGIGVTLTDMNDVVFKLSYYERNYEFLSQKELMEQVQSHYTGQGIKQLYVLVLGLDVIGNPYGLVIGLKKGVEDLFYEPFQGAIQGPGEFAEGLFLGVRSLVGHTVGGAAGAVSRITGAMGHGLAALSLDKDYQRRRRDQINKPPANLQEGLARSGKGLVMGVVDGVTGVFTKPFEGARDHGFEGFFKGLGMGAVGLVARPTSGVVDFASGSFDAVKRAADCSEEVTKRRPARYLTPDKGVVPYSRLEAEGYKMLSELEKGKYVETDKFEAHVWVIPNKEVVLCTDKRILYLEKNVVFGGWQIVWSFLWSEIPEEPSVVAKGVYIPTAKKKMLGLFPSSAQGKVIFLYEEHLKKYLVATCDRLIQASR